MYTEHQASALETSCEFAFFDLAFDAAIMISVVTGVFTK